MQYMDGKNAGGKNRPYTICNATLPSICRNYPLNLKQCSPPIYCSSILLVFLSQLLFIYFPLPYPIYCYSIPYPSSLHLLLRTGSGSVGWDAFAGCCMQLGHSSLHWALSSSVSLPPAGRPESLMPARLRSLQPPAIPQFLPWRNIWSGPGG